MIIMNERKYAERLLDNGEASEGLSYSVTVLAKYLMPEGHDGSQIKEKLNEVISSRYPDITQQKRKSIIAKSLKRAEKYPLSEIDAITITKPEIERINAISSPTLNVHLLKKLAFTLLCLHKFESERKRTTETWINFDYTLIFRIANITVNRQKRIVYLNELIELRLIEASKCMDDMRLKVLFAENGDPEITVYNIDDAGKYFEEYCGKIYVHCERCSRLARKTGYRMKYCPKCAKIIDREKAVIRARKRLMVRKEN